MMVLLTLALTFATASNATTVVEGVRQTTVSYADLDLTRSADTERLYRRLQNAVKVTVFLTDMAHFARVNEGMARHFQAPYPARAAVGVASLPRGALVEIEAVLVLDA